MFANTLAKRVLPGLLIVLIGAANIVQADPGRSKFYKAYYLEQEEGDWAAAAKLYEKVVGDDSADRELRSQAEVRLASCREELASTDFARLMPPEAWVYVELKRPGEQIIKLLDMLGLLAKGELVLDEGEKRLAISPSLIRGLTIRGVAVAITGMDMRNQVPHGVLVFHPGNLEVIRGLMETGLPIGGEVVEPIGGFPTYHVEGQAYVTLTSKLVVVSANRSEIKGVVARLDGKKRQSMADNPALAEVVGNRDDSLLLFFVNAKAMMPTLKGWIGLGAMANREVAMAQTLLDIDSFNSLAGSLGVSDDGLFLDLGLRLEEGHRNLVYNLFRMPAVDPEILESVPNGAAAVLLGALNDAGSRYSSKSSGSADDPPVVTALDFGREIFANITSFAFFALPPDGPAQAGGPPIPDVAAVIKVNDPDKSEALWTQMLGIAAFASGAPAIEGPSETIEGTLVHSYQFPDAVTIYFATSGNDILIGSSKAAVAASIKAKKNGLSIHKDDAFEASLARLTPDSTRALFAHAGRCSEIARQFMSERELAEAAPAFAMLSDTSISVVQDHSGELFRASATVSGIPDIGDFVAQMITKEMGTKGHRKHVAKAKKSGETKKAQKPKKIGKVKKAAKVKEIDKWDKALDIIDSQLAEHPDNLELAKAKFEILATGKKDREAAMEFADAVYARVKDNATALNNLAWSLLAEGTFKDSYADLALKLSLRSNELTDYDNWMFVDTLALAKFHSGDAEEAIELQMKAIELCGDCWGLDDMKKSVAKFKGGL